MTSNILAPCETVEAGQYRLPEADRQAILAQSDSALLRVEIERQRLEFIRRNGTEFGVDDTGQA